MEKRQTKFAVICFHGPASVSIIGQLIFCHCLCNFAKSLVAKGSADTFQDCVSLDNRLLLLGTGDLSYEPVSPLCASDAALALDISVRYFCCKENLNTVL